MGVNLSIKNVREDLVASLKERAKRNHRSLQGELMALVERAASESGQSMTDPLAHGLWEQTRGYASEPRLKSRRLSVREALERMRQFDVATEDNSTEIIRRARDERHGH